MVNLIMGFIIAVHMSSMKRLKLEMVHNSLIDVSPPDLCKKDLLHFAIRTQRLDA